jgi:hypothetical protein
MITYSLRTYAYPSAPVAVPDPLVSPPDEFQVEFDRYMIVYSDSVNCEGEALAARSSLTALMLGDYRTEGSDGAWRAGATSIGCYKGDRLVGSINFYGQLEEPPQSNMTADGLVVLWYPQCCFANVLGLLQRERHLSLSVVCKALDGSQLLPAMGALLTWPEPTGEGKAAA